MRTIPAAVETLLKSRAQAGANAHNHLITISGAPIGASLLDPTSWTTWRTYVGDSPTRMYGNMTETTDGRAVIGYIESNKAYVAFASSVTGVLAGTATFGAGAEIRAAKYGQTSLSLIDG